MPTDQFILSVTQNVETDLAAGRPWKYGVINRVQIVAPAAATTFTWDLRDGADVPFIRQEPNGTAVSYETNAFKPVDMIAEREWLMICRHAGAAAQNITVIVEWQ